MGIFGTENVVVEISDEGDDGFRHGIAGDGLDIAVETDLVISYEGDCNGFWHGIEAWGESVLEELFPCYSMIAMTSDMLATRRPADLSWRQGATGETEFAWMIRHMAGVEGGELVLHGCPLAVCDLLPFEVSFAYPTVTVSSYDIPARDWLAAALRDGTDGLWHGMWELDEEFDLLPSMPSENGWPAESTVDMECK